VVGNQPAHDIDLTPDSIEVVSVSAGVFGRARLKMRPIRRDHRRRLRLGSSRDFKSARPIAGIVGDASKLGKRLARWRPPRR